jgi:hypothetical protein
MSEFPAAEAFQRLLETWLLRVHWVGVPLCLLLIPLFPAVPPGYTLSLALGLATANALLTWMLNAPATSGGLLLIGALSTAVEWVVGLAIVVVCCQDAESTGIALGILLALVAIATARFGALGLVGSELAVGASGVALYEFGGSPMLPSGLMLGRWEAVLLPVGLVLGAVVQARTQAFRWTPARPWERYRICRAASLRCCCSWRTPARATSR